MHGIISFFKYLAESNTINFIIMIGILAAIVIKMNLGASLETSVARVESDIKKSDEEKSKSENLLKISKAAIDKLPEDIENLKNEAELKVDVFKKQIEDNAEKTLSDIKKNADRVISIEEKKISNLMTGKTIKSSIEQAVINIEKMLETEPKLHAAFINDSLQELDKVKL